MKTLTIIASGLFLLCAACEPEEGTSPDENTTSPDAECTPGKVWTDSSQRIRIEGGGFFSRPPSYEIDRAALTEEQLGALHQLCVVPTPETMVSDATYYHVIIEDRAGKETHYRAADYPGAALPEEGENAKLPTLRNLSAFQKSYQCLRTPVGSELSWDSPLVLTTDPGCTNMVFMSRGCGEAPIKLRIDKPGSYTLQTARCRGNLKLALSKDGEQLASSAEAEGTSCPSLTYEFTSAGLYRLDATANTECFASGGTDFELRVSQP